MASTQNGGAKAFGGVMAILAMVGAVAALWQPMNLRLQAIEEQLHDHLKEKDHPAVQTEQIRQLDRRVMENSERIMAITEKREAEVSTDAAQWERIKMVEKVLEGK